MMPSLFWCFQNLNRWKRPDLLGDTLRRSSKAERTIWIYFPCCCTAHRDLESHRPVLNHVFFASSISWPLSSSEVNQRRHPNGILSQSSFWSILGFLFRPFNVCWWWCPRIPGKVLAAQRYMLSLVPASRGHCCSINFSKRLFRDLL